MIPTHVKDLLVAVYGPRWGEAYLEWGLFDGTGNLTPKGKGRAADVVPPDDMAVFWSAGLLKPGLGRGNANVETLKVFVIDDVGRVPGKSRFDPDELELFLPPPTSKPESSPDNAQWQWGFSDGMDEPTMIALRRSLPWQSHATAMSNLIRVPMGVSGKPGVTHKVTDLGRGPVYTAAEFVRLCGGLKVPVKSKASVVAELRAPGGDRQVEAILKLLPNDGVSPYCDSEPAWYNFCQALHGATGGERLDLWQAWCAQWPHAQQRDVEATWDRQDPVNSGWHTLVMYADKWGAGPKSGLAAALFDDGDPLEPEPEPEEEPEPEIVLQAEEVIAYSKLPKRPWLYGKRLLRGYLSGTMAAGGVGKSSLSMIEALAMVTGRDLLGVGEALMPAKPLRVLIWNGEDPKPELQLKLHAALKHYGIDGKDFAGRLFMLSGHDRTIRLAGASDKTDKAWLRGVIKGNKIDVVVVDPFVSSHAASENDNVAIDAVAKTWSKMAVECGCAIDLVHHIRKPATGTVGDLTVDDARGASALVNATRNARVLSPMPDKVAKELGITNRRLYFAIQHDATKANMSPPLVGTSWFKHVNVDLDNGEPVGVVEAWVPTLTGSNDPANIKAGLDAVAKGGPWKYHPSANDWVGKAVAGALGLDPKGDRKVVESVIEKWVVEKWLVVVEKKDAHFELKKFVEVGTRPLHVFDDPVPPDV